MLFYLKVECLACGHVSVTFEPFMYLSLPIPRAMERQISGPSFLSANCIYRSCTCLVCFILVVTFVSVTSELPPMRLDLFLKL